MSGCDTASEATPRQRLPPDTNNLSKVEHGPYPRQQDVCTIFRKAYRQQKQTTGNTIGQSLERAPKSVATQMERIGDANQSSIIR